MSIDAPDGAEILKLISPAFRMRYPNIRYKTLIPAGVLQSMDWVWRKNRFPEKVIRFLLLRNVYVVEEGLVFDSNGKLFRISVSQHTDNEIRRGHVAVLAAIEAGVKPIATDPLVLCKKRGAQNFGHWLMEMLPKAYFAKLHLDCSKLSYMVPAVQGTLGQVIADSLAMLHIGMEAVHCAGPEVVRVTSLIVVDGLTEHGIFMSPLVMNCIDSLSARVPGAGYTKVFVTRPTNVSLRKLINEAEITQRARDNGYVVVEPSTLCIAEQIAAFKNAIEVVGVMGAAMTNIAFAPSEARILNIAPNNMPDTFFWFISGLRGQEYTEMRCLQSGPVRGAAPWDTDLDLPEDSILDLFN